MNILELIDNGIKSYKTEKAAEMVAAELQRSKELSQCRELFRVLGPIKKYFDSVEIAENGNNATPPKHCKNRFYVSAMKGHTELRLYPHSYRFAGSDDRIMTILVGDSESSTGFTIETFCYRLGRFLGGESSYNAFH